MDKLKKILVTIVFFAVFCTSSIEISCINNLGGIILNAAGVEYKVYDYNNVMADVGNNNDYKKPSTSKSTSKSSTSTSSSRNSYGSSRSSSSNSSSRSSRPLTGVEIAIAIIVIILFLLLKKKGLIKPSDRNSNDNSNSNNYFDDNDGIVYISPRYLIVPDNTQEIRIAINEVDPLFSAEKFVGWSQEVFMTLQEAWTERDWSKIRPFEKEELFKMHEKQLQEYIRMQRINVVERISINTSHLYSYQRDAEYEYLKVYLLVAMNDYIIDENTRQVIKGDQDTRYYGKYILTFMRKVGVKTDPSNSNMSTKRCPHCGAPIQITSAGKCEYCDSIITTGEHDWVLSDLDCIKEDNQVGEGGVFIK